MKRTPGHPPLDDDDTSGGSAFGDSVTEHEHDWNGTSNLWLVIKTGHEVFANIFPMAPTLFPIEFCRTCGTVRLSAEALAAMAETERQKAAP